MNLHQWNEIPVEALGEKIRRQVIHTEQLTLAVLQLDTGAIVPRHNHVSEQITNVQSGKLRFIFDDGDVIVSAGESLSIPTNVFHSVETLEGGVALDVFAPRREDWIRGDDAYLRAGR